MADLTWVNASAAVRDCAVPIETPTGRGTGFAVQPPPGTTHQTVMTAHHVIDHALKWREPIRITHFPSGKQAFLGPGARVITPNASRDMALIQFSADDLQLPANGIDILKKKKYVLDSVQVGWLGYPAVAPNNICFFTGYISTWLERDEAYLVDGVAINGVSGGPAFYEGENGKMWIIGIVTEYRPNYATGAPLPGVSLIRSTSPLMEFYDSMQEQIESATVEEIPEQESSGGLPTGLS